MQLVLESPQNQVIHLHLPLRNCVSCISGCTWWHLHNFLVSHCIYMILQNFLQCTYICDFEIIFSWGNVFVLVANSKYLLVYRYSLLVIFSIDNIFPHSIDSFTLPWILKYLSGRANLLFIKVQAISKSEFCQLFFDISARGTKQPAIHDSCELEQSM